MTNIVDKELHQVVQRIERKAAKALGSVGLDDPTHRFCIFYHLYKEAAIAAVMTGALKINEIDHLSSECLKSVRHELGLDPKKSLLRLVK